MKSATTGTSQSGPLPYDFRRPNKFNREHVRALQIANETFARQFTTVLSTTLRSVSQVSLKQVSQYTYDEYIRDIPNPSYLAVLSLAPLAGASLFHIPLPVVMTIIDRLLGGTGGGDLPGRQLTDIEQALFQNFMGRVLHELQYGFEALASIQPAMLHQESNPQFAQISSATDMVVVISYDIRIGTVEDTATLCIPFTSLQPVLDEIVGNALLNGRVAVDPLAVQSVISSRLDNAPLDVSVRFREVTLPSVEIVNLRPGDILPLRHATDLALAVSIAGVPCYRGVAGRKGKRLACLIVDTSEHNEAP
ncbi:MAG: flagellar motor switch protein FliM [Acidimicrobiales bacterium]